MTVKEFEQLKSKVESAKTNKARAEGAKAKIEEQLKKEYKITVDEIDDKLETLNQDRQTCIQRKKKIVVKLESLCNWDEI